MLSSMRTVAAFRFGRGTRPVRPVLLASSSSALRTTLHVQQRWRQRQQRRELHLAPPFLLDDYTPRYQLLSEVDAARKRSQAYAHLQNCNLCPRLCGVNRYETTGVCLIGADVKVNVIAPHFGEGTYPSHSRFLMPNPSFILYGLMHRSYLSSTFSHICHSS